MGDEVPSAWNSELAEASWLIVPLYNEGQVIRSVMQEARRTFPNIVCVDDGSRDNSAQEALAAGVHVVQHPINLGQGAALRTGLDYALAQAGSRYFVTFDSDGQHRVVDAQRMVCRLADDSVDVVIGSRFLDTRTRTGWLKRVILRCAVWFERMRTGMRLSDAHNGLRALNRKAAVAIEINQNRMAHASEIIRQLAATGLPWREFPVRIAYTEYSRAKGQSLLNSVNILVDLIFS